MTDLHPSTQKTHHNPCHSIATILTTCSLALPLALMLSSCQNPNSVVAKPAPVVVASSASAETSHEEQIVAVEVIEAAPVEPVRPAPISQPIPVIVVTPPIADRSAAYVGSSQPMAKTRSVSIQPMSHGYQTKMASPTPAPLRPPMNAENYADIERNTVNSTREQAFATLSIDTDTGSYANMRRFINQGTLPPANSIRVEELINYFNYDFSRAKRQGNAPFLVSTEVVKAPWHKTNRIIKVGIKAQDKIGTTTLPPANLVFLVDVSGSMSSSDKIGMATASLKMLTKQLRPQDTITLVTYAGNTEVVLPATKGSETRKILAAIDSLTAQGSTNGEAAIKLAYQQAQDSFKKDGINRILMLTDGDFNVGVSSVDDMLDIIKKNRDKGISLSTLGFGQGNYNDHMMEQVADSGNGNYSYIDSLSEAKKVLVDEMSATFNTVAKDVKIQVEFNPLTVSEWRLIGYENRVLAKEDFNNDKVDAGELGAGKSVVALFEVTPVGQKGLLDSSRYQSSNSIISGNSYEQGFVKIRYKAPNGTKSKLISYPISNRVTTPSTDLKFAMAVAGYGQLLTDSKYVNNWTYTDVKRLAQSGIGKDKNGIRHEFVKLVELTDALN